MLGEPHEGKYCGCTSASEEVGMRACAKCWRLEEYQDLGIRSENRLVGSFFGRPLLASCGNRPHSRANLVTSLGLPSRSGEASCARTFGGRGSP